MKATTIEWIKKAENDFVSAQREYRARKSPNQDAACFFAQQCIEKYLKGYLQEHGYSFRKTHDLLQLLDIIPENLRLLALRREASILTAYATEFRYPGESALKETAKEAVDFCKVIRLEIRAILSLPAQ